MDFRHWNWEFNLCGVRKMRLTKPGCKWNKRVFQVCVNSVHICGQRSKPECWLCFGVCYYSMTIWNRTCILTSGATPQDLHSSLFFSLPVGGGVIWRQLSLNYSTLCTKWCTCTNIGHPVCSLKGILNDQYLPIANCHYWSFIVVSASPKANKFDPIWINLDVTIQCVGKEST